ncbi:MAG: hypothetical protein A3I20_00670 [Candidatus Portnoybacteria bacterium RIFCSPLOWO2_02_FULL_40_15]|uniref:Transmembrane protein n=1 Tax=Candidatus Portnoybacteria bacterium RIFCSPLOWO2_02_FULL_40_15 TaxID=1802002 RepID=A0A1G2FPW7_9BACT|nr:MAG: hypothetical protein A3I20_00670 [Candidatus Portnoybacteria bacterium RIFCSPLOWO2_02_FULL_40_15]
MRSVKLALIYGLLVWVIPFVVAIAIFQLRESNRPLFESIMPVAVASAVVLFSILYFRKLDKDFINEGIKLGVLWLVISVVIDLLMFSSGPMKMSLALYTSDIGVTYLMMPIITGGTGYLLQAKKKVN